MHSPEAATPKLFLVLLRELNYIIFDFLFRILINAQFLLHFPFCPAPTDTYDRTDGYQYAGPNLDSIRHYRRIKIRHRIGGQGYR